MPFSMNLLLLIFACLYYALLADGQQVVGVSLVLLGQTIPNNSLVNYDDLLYRSDNGQPTNANGLQTLMCVTDLADCCDSPRTVRGDWYYPDGRRVVFNTEGATFQSNRGANEVIGNQQFYGSVRLWRRFTADERGLFQCELPDANGVNQNLYANILFFLRTNDNISVAISPSGSTAVGVTYSLTCSATLSSRNPTLPDPDIPAPTFEWFFGPNGNASLPSGLTPMTTVLSSGTFTSTLQFSPLSQSHAGMYTCRLGAGSLVNSALVTVNAPVTSVQITTSGAPAVGQNSYSLTCGVSGAENLNPSVTYQWNDGQIQVGDDHEVLSFSPLRLSDAGWYTCQATVSSPYLRNDITIIGSIDVTLQIPVPTSVTVSSSIANPIPPFGSDVTLICTVVLTIGLGIDVPLNVTFELLRTDPAGSPLTTTVPSVSGSNYNITATISSFGRNDSGVYTCRARASSASSNAYISDTNTESTSVRISTGVYLALRDVYIANNSNIHIRNIGQSFDSPNGALQCVTDRILCCFSQNPRLGEWYLPNRAALVQGTTSTMAFYRSRGDNGEVSLNRPSNVMSPNGLFCCEVPDATDTNQTVCVNIFTSQILFMASIPVIPVNGSTLLTCTVTDEPVANSAQIVRSMANGEHVVVSNQTNPTGEVMFVVTYLFNNVRFPRDDGALFQCQATNDNGLATQNLTITVQAPPSAIDHVSDVSVRLVSLDSAIITWHIPSSNNAPITSYTLTICAIFSPTDTDCSHGTLDVIIVMVGDLTTVDGNQLSYTYPVLLTERMYEVVVRAENSIGLQMTPALGNGIKFNSAYPVDGRVVNVGFIPTTSTVIVTWNLPALAQATAHLNASFDVMYYSIANPVNVISVPVEYNLLRYEQGFSADLMIAGSPSYVFQIVAWYINPSLLSSQAMLTDVQTLANDASLLTGPHAVVTDTLSPGDILTISWPAPNNTNFLVAYIVSYSTSSRGHRRTSSSVEVPAGMTNTTLPFTAFTNYTVDVDAIYLPPPDGDRVSINLLPSTSFTTPQRPPSPPLNIVAVSEAVLKIRLIWDGPSDPRGIVTGYRIMIESTTGIGVGEVVIDGMTFLSPDLSPNTDYMYQILAINGFGDGEVSPERAFRTSFSVVQPVITSTSIGDAGTPRFTIKTEQFSSRYGGLGIYKVVVVHSSRINPADIPNSQLAPVAEESQFNYYVAYYGDARQQLQSIFVIGDGITTTDGTTNFTNPPPDIGVDYYVFIRLYSSIDPSVFADSQVTGVLKVGIPQSNVGAAVLGSVISFLIILFSIALVFCVLFFIIKKRRKDQEYADVANGAGAIGAYENAAEVDFMVRARGNSRFNPEEFPGHLEMSQNPERLYEDVKQSPVAEDSDSIELNVCPAYGNLINTSDGQP